MSFTNYDFSETLAGCGIDRTDVKRAVAAWGIEGDYAEWEGGFLLEMKDGKYVYVSGWCDTTGWGCQDGTSRKDFDAMPDLATLESDRESWQDKIGEWETSLPDLQKYIDTGEGQWA
jgi:hypothetical protein